MTAESNFSSIERLKYINALESDEYDLLIFGGGITGSGIAIDAVLRGLRVVLIEKNDFASGTSSRSTKLIHGGLRYLEKLQFKFVAQLGRERKIIHKNIAHNIIPTPVYLPIYKNGQLKKWITYLALIVYDLLAGVKTEFKVKWIKRSKLSKNYPNLKIDGLKGAFKYYEYKTNDGRLVYEVLKRAAQFGATCLNFIDVNELLYFNKKVNGAILTDNISGKKLKVRTKYVINATGVWSEKFANKFDSELTKSLYPTKGIHIVLPRNIFLLNEAFYFDTFDKRMVFAIPRQNYVYVGTTDTPYFEDLNCPTAEIKDVEYLVKVVNQVFAGINISINDVVSVWAGIRPLINNNAKKPGELSRKDEIFIADSGLITIVGGKLTGYRLMAKKVVDNIYRKNNLPKVKCKTKNTKLSGSLGNIALEIHELVEYCDNKFDEAKQLGISPVEFKTLFYRYGANIDLITEKAYEFRGVLINTEQIWLKAEVWYAVNYEMCCDLIGFFAFRTEMVIFEPERIKKQFNFVVDCFTEFLEWDTETKNKHINFFNIHWKQYQIINKK